MTTPESKLDALLEYVQADDRVCPQPLLWNELWRMLSGNTRAGLERPSAPLILAAWHVTSDMQKILRLREQIEYAAQAGILDAVDAYLRSLPPDQWHRVGD